MNTGALIVAAGRSSRMGAFKPLLPLGGGTVIGRAAGTLRGFGACPIVAVTGREATRLTNYLQPLGVECVHNPDFAATDMFRSACIGMAALRGRVDGFFFLPGDAPLFSAETLGAMLRRMQASGCGVVRPMYGGRCGHPILIDAAHIPALLAFDGEGGMRGALDSLGCRIDRLEVDDPGLVYDADTPEDYERLVHFAGLQDAGGSA